MVMVKPDGVGTADAANAIVNPNVTQFMLDLLAEEKPAEYEAAQQAIASYVAEGAALSAVPQDVVATLDADIWAAFVAHEQASDAAADRGTVLTEEELASQEEILGVIIRFVAKFIARFWPQIKAAAIRSGKWAWYKGHRCISGATRALYNMSGGNPAVLTLDQRATLTAAIQGCIRSL